ncbi:MAG: hypothetical protein AB1716_09810 [Planctomycetota bacterium]
MQAQTNLILQHNSFYNDPNDPNDPYFTVLQNPERQITIHHGVAGQTFEFEAVLLSDPNDPNSYVGPGDINLIGADPNAGPVTITVVGHNGHAYGAANVKEIRLNATGVNGRVDALTIAASLNELGATVAASAGILNIEGQVLAPIDVGDISGPVWIRGCLYSAIQCGSLGNLTIDGTGTPPSFPPAIYVTGTYEEGRVMSIGQSISSLTVGGALAGRIEVDAAAGVASVNHLWIGTGGIASTGSLSIDGTLDDATVPGIAHGGWLTVGELRDAMLGELPGRVEVLGAVPFGAYVDFGAMLETGYLRVGTLAGTVSFTAPPPEGGGQPAILGTVSIGSIVSTGTFWVVQGDLAGTIQIENNADGGIRFWQLLADRIGLTGTIEVLGNMSGEVFCYGPLDGGLLWVHGELDGSISFKGDAVHPGISGTVRVGKVDGSI